MRWIRSAFVRGSWVPLALALAAPAHASGSVNLAWSRCSGEGAGSQNAAFACDTNAGQEVLVASFQLPADLAQVSGNEIVIDLLSQDDPMPAWWDFKNAGTCRQTSLSLNFAQDPGDVVCMNWQGGVASGGIGAYDMSGVPPDGNIDPSLATRHRKLKIALAVPPDALANLLAETEYFSCNIVINHAKTVGTGACGGCSGSVCLVLQDINVTTPVLANNIKMYGGTTPGSDWAHWQGSVADCALVPVKNKTWGQVKALYR